MRGEHLEKRPRLLRYMGSSPHARGAQLCDALDVVEDGIIPACAGSTVFYLQAYQKSHSTLFTFFA